MLNGTPDGDEVGPSGGGNSTSPAAVHATAHKAAEAPSSYLMESADEVKRLELKTDALSVRRQLMMTGLRAGMSALDVGCGSGAVTRAMALLGAVRPVGVDFSNGRVEAARALAREHGAEVEFVHGDATQLPFSTACFDYAWSRFLFEYLPEKTAVLREMMRVTRPGGRVVVGDLDGQLQAFHPMDPELADEWQAALRLLEAAGFDPNAGRKLYQIFRNAGLEDIRVTAEMHQVFAGTLPERERFNWRQKLAIGLELLKRATGEERRWTHLWQRMTNLLEGDGLYYHSTLVLVSGRVPA